MMPVLVRAVLLPTLQTFRMEDGDVPLNTVTPHQKMNPLPLAKAESNN